MAESTSPASVTLTPQESTVIQVASDEFRKTGISFRDYLLTLYREKTKGDYVVSFHYAIKDKSRPNLVRFGSPSDKPTFEVIIKTTPTSIDIVKSYFAR